MQGRHHAELLIALTAALASSGAAHSSDVSCIYCSYLANQYVYAVQRQHPSMHLPSVLYKYPIASISVLKRMHF